MTERLPAVCADDVLDVIRTLCEDHENDNAWHGACLMLAELARRGFYYQDDLQGQHSLGSHVRDAVCYTCLAYMLQSF